MDSLKKCEIKIVKDPKLGWKVKAIGDCQDLENVLDDLPNLKKRYLERRLNYSSEDSDSSSSSVYSSNKISTASPKSENPSG